MPLSFLLDLEPRLIQTEKFLGLGHNGGPSGRHDGLIRECTQLVFHSKRSSRSTTNTHKQLQGRPS
jgi:hypothetical protein